MKKPPIAFIIDFNSLKGSLTPIIVNSNQKKNEVFISLYTCVKNMN